MSRRLDVPPVRAVVVIGETLIDVVPASRGDDVDPGARELPGGSPANVAVTLGRLGRGPVLVTTLADDAHGAAARDWLEAADVTVVAQPPATGRTSTAAVRLAADGSATYDYDLSWDLASETLTRAAVPGGIAVLHAGSIATVLDPGAATVEAALREARGRALVTFDPNARPAITPDVAQVLPRVEPLVGLSDVVKVSDEDLGWYHPGTDPMEVARAWGADPPTPAEVDAVAQATTG
ncbi:PfkB family carbohydrate kinase [Micromonospora echinospora]|uniref:PfkB family carbohydrate kinase n=1 Tax=Micromonospora echinospora TaxID=1877 RepID=UPI0033C74FB5